MVFVVLTVVLGASTAYLLAVPSTGNHTVTQTTTSTVTTATGSVSITGSQAYTVGIAYKEGIGFYLVNGSGFTLYFRTTDDPQTGASTCTGSCVTFWPVFYTQNLVLPPGLSASSFQTVTRPDGRMQITYNGWPLYTYSGDSASGDTNGQGMQGIWFAYTLPTPSQITSTTSVTTSSASTSSSSSSSSYSYGYG